MKLTYKQMFDTLVDAYIRDSKYADGGLPCCMFLNKDECSDIKKKGESACQKCVRKMVEKEAEGKYTNH